MLLNFEFLDFIDIFLVAIMLYYSYRVMKESRSMNVFIGILIFILLWLVVSVVLEMKLLGSILDKLVSVGVIGLIVLFQKEIRQFFYNLGAQQRMSPLLRFIMGRRKAPVDMKYIMPMVGACMSMAKDKVGALIVVERNIPLDEFMQERGEMVDANINQRLIENIFYKGSPLHDGAMIISKKRILAAGCVLPVSHSLDIPKELGLRHRAGIGITEETDALAIIVSEETGRVSVAVNGKINVRLSFEDLESFLVKELRQD